MKNNPHNLPMNFQTNAEVYLYKLDNNLWCLSERLCVLLLFSSKVNVAEKKILDKTFLKQTMLSQPLDQNMPVVIWQLIRMIWSA